jgi:hypothetical protein
MLMTNSTLSNVHRHYKRLCPCCGATKLKILASTPMSCEVVFDSKLDELIVVNENMGDTEWDEHSRVECPTCKWQGELQEGLNPK